MNPFINRLRGLLAMCVVIWHAASIVFTYPAMPDVFQRVVRPLLIFTGFNSVLGFIVVSGYCIARSTLSKGGDFSLAQYAAMRVTRIYPSMIACACIAGIVEMALFDSPLRSSVWNAGVSLPNFVVSLFGMSGFLGQFGSYAPSYTVSYELLFYLLWGIVFAYAPKQFTIPVSLLVGVALFFLLPARFGFAVVLFASWLMGAAIAVYEAPIAKLVGRISLWAMWPAVLVTFWVGISHAPVIWDYPGSLVTIPGGLLFAIIIACHLSRQAISLPVDNWLGDISYPLFLVHGPVIIAVAAVLKAGGVALSFGAMLAILIGSAILVAQAVLVTVERPVMRMRRSAISTAIAPRIDSKTVAAEVA